MSSNSKPTPKEVYEALSDWKGKRQLKDWHERELLSRKRLGKLRFGKKKHTVLHVAIDQVERENFVWLLDKVPMELLETAYKDGQTPLEMIEERMKAITSKQAMGEDYYDSVSYAAANQRGRKLTGKERYDLQELGKMKEALEKTLTKRVGMGMMALSTEQGSLVGVEMVHKHFPDLFDHMDHHEVLDLVEHAEDLGHEHIAEYIASQVE